MPRDPWCTVVVTIKFPHEEEPALVTSYPVADGETIQEACSKAADSLINYAVRFYNRRSVA